MHGGEQREWSRSDPSEAGPKPLLHRAALSTPIRDDLEVADNANRSHATARMRGIDHILFYRAAKRTHVCSTLLVTSRLQPLAPNIVTEHRDRIERFVVRARRLEEHSLLSDRAKFVRWTSGRLDVDPTAGTVTWQLPPEEAFESLAARARPLLLEKDGLSLLSVLGSLKAFVRDDKPRLVQLTNLRTQWTKVKNPEAPISLAQVDPASGLADETYDQVAAADAWLYGDLVHASQPPPNMAPIQMRYPLAVLVFGRAVVLALAALELVRKWDTEGLLSLRSEVWAQKVTAEVPYVIHGTPARVAASTDG